MLCLPVFTAQRSPINSDQSLYLAEALNIADGKGLTYPNGEPVTHRPPLYPALLAGALRLEGGSLDAAYLVPRLAILVNVLLLYFLGRALFGAWGGVVAACSAAASLYLRGLGTSLYLDSSQATFLLAALLVYWRAGSRPLGAAGAGALLGASFLIKEASILFLPLPLVMSMVYGFDAGWKKALPAWFAGFGATTAWWWIWVFIQSGNIYLAGPPGGLFTVVLALVALPSIVAVVALLRVTPSQVERSRLTLACAAATLIGWNAVFFAGLDLTGWQYDSDYLTNLGAYLTDIFLPNVQPAALILGGWAWAVWSAARSRSAGLLLCGVLLYGSFFVIVADRGLSLRDQLPIIYFSYLALGGAAAWLVRTGASVDLGARVRALGGGGPVAVVAALAAIVFLSGSSLSQPKAAGLQDDWDNPLSRQTAAWLEQNVEPGASVSSSRLYFSHLYFLTGGAYPIHQLPTVEVNLHTAPEAAEPLTRRSALFRWGDFDLPADSPDDRWLYLTRYPQKGYFVALAEDDLLAHLREHQTEYVVVSTRDAGFSSPSFNRYFEDNPAFELVKVFSATSEDEARIYRVDLAQLQRRDKPAQITASAYEYVIHRLTSPEEATEYLERLNPAGFKLTER
jgi:4-amino-4-deoxy-L-arabinose transferase-like glycosyltransferase